MNRNIRLALVLGTFALLFCADAAQAQRRVGWGRGYGGYQGGYYGGYGDYQGGYYGGYGLSLGYGANNYYPGYSSNYYSSPGYYGGSSYYPGYSSGYGYYPNYSSGYTYPNYGYSTGYYNTTPNYTSQPYNSGGVYSSTPSTTQSLYGDASAAASVARIRVTVPTADTRIVINGAQTTSMGMERIFESPRLEAGKVYTYTIQATWMQNGQEMTRQQDIQVHPGQETYATFRFDSGNVTQDNRLPDNRTIVVPNNRTTTVVPVVPDNRNPNVVPVVPDNRDPNAPRPDHRNPDGTRTPDNRPAPENRDNRDRPLPIPPG